MSDRFGDIRGRVGAVLRNAADRIDGEHAVARFPAYWAYTERGIRVTVTDGIQVYPEDPGAPLFFMVNHHYRAFDPSVLLGRSDE